MKVTKPIRTMYLYHKQTYGTLELRTGDDALINTAKESVYGTVEQISYHNGYPFIKLHSTDPIPTTFYVADITSIGGVKLNDYDIKIDDYIGDYELEIDKNKPSIMLTKGDIVEVTYTTTSRNAYKITGILSKVSDISLTIKTYCPITEIMVNTIISEDTLHNIKVIAKTEHNNTFSRVLPSI